jgi:SWIM zinc finger
MVTARRTYQRIRTQPGRGVVGALVCGEPGDTPGVPLGDMTVRPTPEQVLLLASDRDAAAAATTAANPASWSAAGCDDGAVWGQYIATSAEPYDVAIDLGGPAFRCSCPSRKVPCKHCLGLLLLHAEQHVAPAPRLAFARDWMNRRDGHPSTHERSATPQLQAAGDHSVPTEATPGVRRSAGLGGGADPQRDKRRLERAERMRAGVIELDRWLADRVRTGLAAPDLAEPETWQRVASRLVDAQCGALANRVKRIAALVGANSRWHEDVLEELAVLHGLARGALRTSALPDDLADGVHAATGLTIARDDVLAGVPSTARWLVMGESRVREDLITVQRTWLCCRDEATSGPLTWAMLLAFGAFGRDVTSEHVVGTELHADMHWYPGAVALRSIVGRMYGPAAVTPSAPRPQSLGEAVAAAGWAIAREPWLERYPVCVAAVPTPIGNGRWALVDHSGDIPIVPGFWRLAELVSLSGGRPITIVGEHSAEGILPLTVWSFGQPVVLT